MKDKLSGTQKDPSIRAAMAPLSLFYRQTDTHVHTHTRKHTLRHHVVYKSQKKNK